MSPPFDPYHKWLGIPPEEQPPHHYRLLGIKPFETDPDVVESAADQRMRHLRSFQAGKNGALSQKLLNEIAAAKVCLLEPTQRAEYDAQLRKILSPPKPLAKPIARAIPLAESSPLPAAPSAFPVVTQSRSEPVVVAPAGGKAPVGLIAIGAAGALLLVVAAVVVAINWNGTGEKSGAGNVTIAQRPPEPKSQSPANSPPVGESPLAPTPKVDPVNSPAAPQPESPRPSPDPAPPPMGEAPLLVPAPVPPPDPTPASLPPIAPAVGITTELVPLIDTKKAQTSGEWIFDGRALMAAGGGPHIVLQIPLAPPEEYDLHLVLRKGVERAMGVVLPVGKSSVLLAFDHNRQSAGHVSGLSLLDGQWCYDRRGGNSSEILPNDQDVPVVVRIRHNRVRVERGTDVVFDWAGDFSRCTLPSEVQVTNPRQLAVYANRAKCWFSRVAITPVAGGVNAAANAAGQPSASTRKPVPTDAQQAVVREKLNDITSAAPKRTAADKLKLATDLFKLAKDAQDNPAERYVLLRETQRWAAEAGDPRLALDATDLLAAEYELDSAAEVLKVTSALVAAAKEDAAIGAVLEAVLPLAKQATAAQQFDAAQRMLEGLVRLVQRPAGRKFAAQVAELRAANTEAAKVTRRLDAAREKLKNDPSDAEANLALASWLCFVSDDWTAGLPHLSKSGDATLQACAAKELPSPPTSAEDQAALGDLWWDAGQKIAKEFRPGALARAAHWYRRALPDSAGLVKVKIEKRLEELALAGPAVKIKPGRAGRVLVVAEYENERNQARAAGQRLGLAVDETSVFDKNRTDYSAYSTIIGGSNAMDYWGRDDTRDQAHFQHVERFVNEGGHLVLCGSYNGRNCENLARFGFYTGFRHAETFASAGKSTDLLFQGALEVVPQSGHLKSFGDILCTVPNDVLLRVGEGRRQGEPALITLRHKKGRVTFTECEPGVENDLWLIDVLLSWVARGSPVPEPTP